MRSKDVPSPYGKPSGYYSWRIRPLSQRALFDRYLLSQIQQVHVASRQNYGAIKTWKALTASGIRCGKHRVARLRRIHGIQSKRRKRFKVTTLSKDTKWIAPNRLNRCFQVAKPNQAWVGMLRLSPPVAAALPGNLARSVFPQDYRLGDVEQNNKQLVASALDMALERRQRGLRWYIIPTVEASTDRMSIDVSLPRRAWYPAWAVKATVMIMPSPRASSARWRTNYSMAKGLYQESRQSQRYLSLWKYFTIDNDCINHYAMLRRRCRIRSCLLIHVSVKPGSTHFYIIFQNITQNRNVSFIHNLW